jgi:hypothetical protein
MDDVNYMRFCKVCLLGFISLFIFIAFTSCTISMNMVSTEGTASDVIDETQSPTNDVKADVSVPVSGI